MDCNEDVAGYFQYTLNKILCNYHVPRMNLNDFFMGLESFFNIRFFVNNATRSVRLISVDKIVKATDYTEFSKQLLSINTEPEDQIKGYHFKMEMDTDDEFWAIAKVNETFLLEHIKSSVQSISDLKPWPASINFDIRFVRDQGVYYMLFNNVWAAYDFMGNTLTMNSEFICYDDDQTINTKTSTLIHETDPPYNVVIGNSRADWEKATQKLLFVQYEDYGNGDRKVLGRHNTTTNNLFYCGEYGLFNKHYKAFVDFRMKTKLVKIVKQMTYLELKEFDFSKKYMINGIKYLVKSIQVVLKKDRIMPAFLECYTID